MYEVRYWTLYRRQKGIQSQRDTTPQSRRLSDLEEQIIIRFILDLDSQGFPPRLRDVEEVANRLLADRDASPVGKLSQVRHDLNEPQETTALSNRAVCFKICGLE